MHLFVPFWVNSVAVVFLMSSDLEKNSQLLSNLGWHTCHLGVLLKEMGSVMRQYFCDDSSFLEIIVNKVGQFPTQIEIRFIYSPYNPYRGCKLKMVVFVLCLQVVMELFDILFCTDDFWNYGNLHFTVYLEGYCLCGGNISF